MIRLWWIGGLGALVILSGCATTDQPSTKQGQVVRTVDGDTLEVDTGGEQITVRLIGIDSPETVAPNRPVECGGPEASELMTRLATDRRVRLEYDPSQDTIDQYDRHLAYVYPAKSDVTLQEAILKAGYAEVYVYQNRAFELVDRFKSAEQSARAHARGIWSEC